MKLRKRTNNNKTKPAFKRKKVYSIQAASQIEQQILTMWSVVELHRKTKEMPNEMNAAPAGH